MVKNFLNRTRGGWHDSNSKMIWQRWERDDKINLFSIRLRLSNFVEQQQHRHPGFAHIQIAQLSAVVVAAVTVKRN